ncbi:MAG: RDD family protein [Niabella sp.]
MNDTFSLNTTQNVLIDYQLAGIGDRLLAWLLDMVIQIAYLFVVGFSLSSFMNRFGGEWLFYVLLLLPLLFYHLLFEMFMNGQTPGKRALKIRVMLSDGRNATFRQYFIRWVFRLFDISFTQGVAALFAIALSNKKQRIGDMVANTIVVKTNPRSTETVDLLKIQAEMDNYVIQYPEVQHLHPADITLIKDILQNIYKSNNFVVAQQAADKIEAILQVKRREEPVSFLQTVLNDYRHL